MIASGPGIFFDGRISARLSVVVELDRASLIARGGEGQILARWPYDELQRLSAPSGWLRFARRDNAVPARLEVRDPALVAAIDGMTLAVVPPPTERRQRRRVIIWSIAAAVALVVVGTLGVPEMAERLAPFVPDAVEQRLGDVVDQRVRSMLEGGGPGQRLECGMGPTETSGRAALDEMVGRLAAVAALPRPLNVAVIRRSDPNAFALPGGRIYVFEGLVARSDTPDELAGVIAHEMGHVAHRDATKSVVRTAGLSFVFGIVLGDFVGGGAVVVAAKALLQSAYSRDVESAADAYAIDLMQKAGADARALGSILMRISGALEPGMAMLRDHPETRDRVAAIDAATPAHSGAAMLSPIAWATLKRICSGM